MKSIQALILIAPLLFAGCCCTRSDKASGSSHALVPTHFWFDYPYQPSPGKRYWTVVGRTWIEQYEAGNYSRFAVLEHTTIEGISGTVVVKLTGDREQTWTGNEGDFQAFIPDMESAKMLFRYRNKINGQWQPWRDLAEMQGVE